MTTVEVRTLAYVSDLFGAKRFSYEFEGIKTVYELLHDLDVEYGLGDVVYNADGGIADNIRIILHGRDAQFLSNEQLYLQEGDIVLIMPVLAGG